MISPNPLLGTAFHAVGAAFAALCYTPQKRVSGWSWQSYWLVQAVFCWFLLPILGAWLTIPDLAAVLREAPRGAMLASFALGAAYGIGGTAFGISIRYIGYSLTYAIAIGFSAVLGTFIPPLIKGTLAATMAKPGAGWAITGMAIGLIGIAFTGAAGRMKERDLSAASTLGGFSMIKGLSLSILAGILSAVYGLALEAGDPIANVASAHGAGVFRGNVIYIFANTGAFFSTALYCLWLHAKHGTLGEIVELPAGVEEARLPINWAMAVLTGCLWYGQFFFFNLGHVRMGDYKFISWAVHMLMLILFSIALGVALREWRECRRVTKVTIGFAFVVLVGAVLALAFGNYIANSLQAGEKKAVEIRNEITGQFALEKVPPPEQTIYAWT